MIAQFSTTSTASIGTLGPLSIWSAMMIWARLLPIAFVLPCLGSAPAPPGARIALVVVVSTLALASLATSMLAGPVLHALSSGEPIANLSPNRTPVSLLELEHLLALDTWQRGLALAREFLIGAVIGCAAASIFWASRAGFQLLGHALLGLRSDSGFDSSMSSLGVALGVAIFFAVDGHIALVHALAASYRALPVAAPSGSSAQLAALELIRIGARVIDIAISLAAPVLVAGGLAQLAVALLQRVQPGIRIAPIIRPTGTLVGLLVAAIALTTMAVYLAAEIDTMPNTLQQRVQRDSPSAHD